MKEQFHSRIAKLLVVFALAVVASVMFVFVGCAPQEEEPAPEHTHTWETVTEDPTCGTDGYTYQECSCGEERNFRVLPATGEHEWETVTEAATCTTNGYTLQVCANCGTEGTRTSIEALGHDYQVVTEGAVEETCTTNGYHFEECTRCHDRKQITDPALGHDLVAGTPIAATCELNGYTPYECSRCDYTEQRNVVLATGHDFGELQLYVPDDCTTAGYWYKECENCDYQETSSYEPARGHMIDFDATTTKINPLTCTADGTVEYVCADCGTTHTATADQIAAGTVRFEGTMPLKNGTDTEGEQILYYATNLMDKVGVSNDFTNNAENAAKYFLKSYGHAYTDDNTYSCVKVDTYTPEGGDADDAVDIWNSCPNCDTIFEVTDHTKPVGAKPCVSIADNKDYKGSLTGLTAQEMKDWAYVCTTCGEGIPVAEEHNYVISTLVSGNPVLDGYDKCTFAPATGVTTLTCEYYYVCADCGAVKIAAPHTAPATTDTANYRNCAHGDYCTVCNVEMTLALPHNFDGHVTETNEVTFGDFAYVAPTCTTKGYTYDFCTMCAAREEAGEDVKWEAVSNTNPDGNYKANEKAAYDHNWDTLTTEDAELPDDLYNAGYYVIKVSRKGDNVEATCTTGWYERDICQICGETRKEVRPTIYKQEGQGFGVKYTALKNETEYDTATSNGGVVYVANSAVPGGYEKYNGTWDKNAIGRPYTDANGNYGGVGPNEHQYVLVELTEYDQTQIDNMVYPVCNKQTAHMLYKCEQCGFTAFRDVSLAEYVANLNGKTVATANASDLDQWVENWINDRDEDKLWHVDEKIPCGHQVCEACTDGRHVEQYRIAFDAEFAEDVPTSAVMPEIADYIGWVCWDEAQDIVHFVEYIAEVKAANPNFKLSYYTDEDMSKSLTVTSADDAGLKELLGPDEDGTTLTKDLTLYVKVEMADGWKNVTPSGEEELAAAAVNLGYNSANRICWVHDNASPNRTQYLDVEFQLDLDVVPLNSITSITVTIEKDSYTYAKAVCSTAAQRANLIAWANANFGIDKTSNKMWLQVEEFCNVVSVPEMSNLGNVFTVTNEIEFGTDLEGYSLKIEIVAGGHTYSNSVTIAADSTYLISQEYPAGEKLDTVLVDHPELLA